LTWAAFLPASGPGVSDPNVTGLGAPWGVAGPRTTSGSGATAPSPTSYRLRVDAVAYHLPGRTALGIPVRKGVVAVDPKLIPLGTKLFIPGYGQGVAADVGVAIKGRIIDLWMPNHTAARKWGRKTVIITIFP
jgi:3D (Asp-Asp-Asp) domain-containing protein